MCRRKQILVSKCIWNFNTKPELNVINVLIQYINVDMYKTSIYASTYMKYTYLLIQRTAKNAIENWNIRKTEVIHLSPFCLNL